MNECLLKAPPRRESAQMRAVGAAQTASRPGLPDSGSAAPYFGKDFDFLHGQWLVENRRLAEPLGRPEDWIGFDTIHSCRSILNGAGHLEETASEDGASWATLRLLDPRNRRWTVHCISPLDGTLRTPLTGTFESGVGTFVGEDTWRGRTVRLRETWLRTTAKPRWELAFSLDGGATWNECWLRDFTRVYWPL
ncbi:MAG: hypothetical protein JXB36_00950 [Gammaproteobacteria bacterium]|nr:hypothetical protein [Gammaproteobacteria bacterium]